MKAIRGNYQGRIQRAKLLPYFRLLIVLSLITAAISWHAQASGTWTPLANQPLTGLRNGLLLGDGTVLCGDGGRGWYRLTPDIHGSYINGTWSSLATSHYNRFYYSSEVLTNGNVYIAGGEYGDGGDHAELYDSVHNFWTEIPAPSSHPDYSDAISKMLPNGNVLQGTTGAGTWIYNPVANTITAGVAAARGQDETCWVRLPNDNILTLDGGTNAEHFVPSLNKWYQDADLPVRLFGYGYELGPGFVLPNGNVFYIGASIYTAIYTPGSSPTNAGTWVAGPQMVFGTNTYGAVDAPSAMMVNGNILCALGATNGFGSSTSFFEYDYTTNGFTQINGPTGLTFSAAPFVSTMLDLPDGSVLFIPDQKQLYVYTPNGTPLAAGQPVINSFTEKTDGTYVLSGTGLNGISAGAAYGDDWQMDSNYPLVRMTNSATGNVYYARTFGWNSTGVMTGSQIVTTSVSLPANLPAGTYSLVAVANGNASTPITFVYSPLAAPSGLGATIGNAHLGLSWNAVSGATSYNLKRSTNGGVYYDSIAVVSGTNYTDNAVINGATYYYVVASIGPNGPSTNSSPLIAVPVGPPPAPKGLVAGADSYLGVNLAWNAVPTAQYYNVKRATTNGGPYAIITTTAVPGYDDINVNANATYYYIVSAVSANGEGANSTQAAATPSGIGDVTNGLVGYWKFDDGSGTNALDSSGNNNTGTLLNGPTWVSPGRAGSGALSFSNTNLQSVSVANAASLNMTSAITIAAWVNALDWSGNHRILEKGNTDNQYALYAQNNELWFRLNGVNTIVCALPATGAWAYVAGTYDGTTMTLYVNGQAQTTFAATGSISTTSNPLVIAKKNNSTSTNDYMNGELDEVRLYNRALTLAEINTIMHYGDVFPVAPAGLAAAPGYAQVNLSWTASAGANNYEIWRGTIAGGPYTNIGTTFNPYYTDQGLANGTTYYYVVAAQNFVNGSPFSNEAHAAPGVGVTFFQNANYVGPGSQLLAPGNYLLSQLQSAGVVNDATSSCLIPPGWTVTAYLNDNYGGQSWTLTQSMPDFVVVSGLNNNMTSCKITAPSLPSSPTSLTAAAGDAQIGLSWHASSGASEYNLQRSLLNGGPYISIANITTTNFNDGGLTNGTTYYYVVSAISPLGNTVNSTQASATPGFSPIFLSSGPPTPGQFTFQFQGIPGRNYVVQISIDLVNWIPVVTNQTVGSTFSFTDTNAIDAARFYRVME